MGTSRITKPVNTSPTGQRPQTTEPRLGEHPLDDVIGSMSGPNWDAVLRNIKRNRKELDRLVLSDESES